MLLCLVLYSTVHLLDKVFYVMVTVDNDSADGNGVTDLCNQTTVIIAHIIAAIHRCKKTSKYLNASCKVAKQIR